MTEPRYFRWHWPKGSEPVVLMEYPSMEQAERDLPAVEVDPDDPEAWFEDGISGEAELKSEAEFEPDLSPLGEAWRRFETENAERLQAEVGAFEDNIERLKGEVHEAEHEAIRKFLRGD